MTDEQRLQLEINGQKGADVLMRKLGDKSKEHFSRLGKLSAEKRRQQKANAPVREGQGHVSARS